MTKGIRAVTRSWIVVFGASAALASLGLTSGCGGSGAGAAGQGGAGAAGQGGAGGAGASGSTGGAPGVDECALGTHTCAAEAICTDTPAFYECSCMPGYAGDGEACLDVDECAGLLADCDANAACTNTAGSYTCACSPGFVGDGKVCDARYIDVSAGQLHACAVRADKTLWCWGLNTSGQVGTGTGDPVFLRPAAAGDASDWSRVSAGGSFTCALDGSKAISCFGSNSLGQCGNGTTATALNPTPIKGGASDWTALEAGATHACAIHADGSLACWGSNNRGQVGDGTLENKTEPTLVSAGPWSMVSAGSEFTCGVRGDGTLWCWGLNTSRQLGDGTTNNSSVPVQEKTLAADWAEVSAGNAYACGVKKDGTRWCWGTNSLGQGGDTTTSSITQPKGVDVETDWSDLRAGDFSACARRGGGALYCWGEGSVGQTAQQGNETLALAPASVGADTDWTALSVGLRFACGIRADGRLFCWGSATKAATGLGYSSDRSDPTAVGSETTWESVDTQLDDGCAIRKGGDLSCWGRNISGNLGDGTLVTRAEPAAVGAGKVWSRVAVGRTHTCGIATDVGVNGLYCWGFDANGELGNGAGTTNTPTPTLVPATPGNTSAWKEVAAGFNHTCAIREDSTLWCWGRNAFGQLGDASTTTRSDPKQVLPMGAADWIDVAASGDFTCARRGAGALFCWGRNDGAHLGLGNINSPVTSPTQVGAALYKAVDAGANHACAVAMDGALWCWGRNASGELGLGNTVSPVLSPIQVGSDKDWARPVLGQGTFMCALKQGGALSCWGTNSFGQLGLGSTTSFTTPQKVSSVAGFSALSLGVDHACGVEGDGRLSCWGGSYWAQLGGGVPFTSTPTLVVDPP